MILRLQARALSGLLAALAVASPPGRCAGGRDYPIQPVPFHAVRMTGGFWAPRMATNRLVTVPYTLRKCRETGRIANFEVAGGLKPGGFQGIYFNDSDVFKVIEGAAYTLALHPDPELDRELDALIAIIAAAQEDDGYLYTARTIADPDYRYPGRDGGRWSHLAHGHELYNVGHLYEAAVAHWQVTGKRGLLDVAIRNADLVCRVFGPAAGQRIDVPGHPEIEIGLVKLYRATGQTNYLDQARFFVDMRGREDLRGRLYGPYAQDHRPLVEQTEAVGHAVRGGYFYAGVADVAAITGDPAMVAAIQRIWEDVVDRKLYLTGNVGQHDAGEGYAGAYKLSNLKAYNETCAAIALALWNHRMFLLTGDARFMDVVEVILYNGFLSGVSLSGDTFFYPNPLACDLQFQFNRGHLERSPWFDCSCCPVNVVRFMPSIPGLMFAVREDSVYMNLYADGQADLAVDGTPVQLTTVTRYPWDGRVRITVQPDAPREFALHLRLPGWRTQPLPGALYRYLDPSPAGYHLTVNGRPTPPQEVSGYAVLRRTWQPGDVVELTLDLPVRRVTCDPQVVDNRGRIAIQRGPVVYCVEGADHAGTVMDLFLEDGAVLTPEHRPGMLGGVTVLTGSGGRAASAGEGNPAPSPVELTFIPYYAWCHRGANEMQVWMPRANGKGRSPDSDLANPSP